MASTAAPAPHSEWATNWPLLLSAFAGMPLVAAMSYSLGQFLGPLEQEFGWSRSQASIGFSLSLVLGFLGGPPIGRLVDKTNARRLALPGIVLVGLSISALSLATASTALWIALWCVVALAGLLVGPVIWLAVVSAAFENNRSLAISITLCGMSLAAMFAPLSARWFIDNFGWRMAFPMVALLWCGPAFLLALFCFFDRRPASQSQPRKAELTKNEPPAAKPDMRSVFLSATFIRMAIAITLNTTAMAAFTIHLSPALSDKGMSGTVAATTAGLIGLAAIPGKLAVGTLFDRIGQVPVTLGLMATLAIACILLAQDTTSVPLAIVGSALLGIASGSTNVAFACITARLFEGPIFGVVYGTLTSLTALSGAAGPFLISMVHDGAGSYAPAFWSGIGVAAVVALLLTRLRPVSS
jgi:MFS family permease